MTKVEIYNIFDIPITTLNEWQKPSSRKHKLYSFLIQLDKESINTTTKKNKHRFFHILNRNIEDKYHYSYEEIKEAFSKSKYDDTLDRAKLIYAKFFKEFESDDLEHFCEYFQVNKRNVKQIYASSPYRKLKGVAKVWDKRFRLKHISENCSFISNCI